MTSEFWAFNAATKNNDELVPGTTKWIANELFFGNKEMEELSKAHLENVLSEISEMNMFVSQAINGVVTFPEIESNDVQETKQTSEVKSPINILKSHDINTHLLLDSSRDINHSLLNENFDIENTHKDEILSVKRRSFTELNCHSLVVNETRTKNTLDLSVQLDHETNRSKEWQKANEKETKESMHISRMSKNGNENKSKNEFENKNENGGDISKMMKKIKKKKYGVHLPSVQQKNDNDKKWSMHENDLNWRDSIKMRKDNRWKSGEGKKTEVLRTTNRFLTTTLNSSNPQFKQSNDQQELTIGKQTRHMGGLKGGQFSTSTREISVGETPKRMENKETFPVCDGWNSNDLCTDRDLVDNPRNNEPKRRKIKIDVNCSFLRDNARDLIESSFGISNRAERLKNSKITRISESEKIVKNKSSVNSTLMSNNHDDLTSVRLPEIMSDQEDNEETLILKDWAKEPELYEIILRNRNIDPISIFGKIPKLNIDTVFNTQSSRNRGKLTPEN